LGTTVAPYSPVGVANASTPRTGPAHHELSLDQFFNFTSQGVELSEIFYLEHDFERAAAVLLGDLMAQPSRSLPEAFFFEIYASPPQSSFLSPTRHSRAVRIDIVASQAHADPYTEFARHWRMHAAAAGGKLPLHWAKFLPTRSGDEDLLCAVRAAYNADELEAFRKCIDSEDPFGVFKDAYWRRVLWDDLSC